MRVSRLIAAPVGSVALLCLSACAGTATGENSYSARMDRLTAECTARQGILASTGATTGRPETDYACRISGGATRIERNN